MLEGLAAFRHLRSAPSDTSHRTADLTAPGARGEIQTGSQVGNTFHSVYTKVGKCRCTLTVQRAHVDINAHIHRRGRPVFQPH